MLPHEKLGNTSKKAECLHPLNWNKTKHSLTQLLTIDYSSLSIKKDNLTSMRLSLYKFSKERQTYKPGPVSRKRDFYHLSRTRVTPDLKQPTPRHRPSKPTCAGIHGFATHKVHSYRCHHQYWWALTPPFHPYSLRSGYFLLYYYSLSTIFPLGSMALCVARTFLSSLRSSDRTVCRCKDRNISVNSTAD